MLSESQPEQAKVHLTKGQLEIALIEAALYAAGRPLKIKEICSILKTRSKKKTQKLITLLVKKYKEANSSLEILELKDEKYVFQLKAEFAPKIKKLVKNPLLSTGPLKTLAYISYNQPIEQKKVIEVRGNHVYGHLKILKEKGLIESKKKGRTNLLKTTEYFADYFGLSYDTGTSKKQLIRIFNKA